MKKAIALFFILMGAACSRSYELYHTRDTVTFSCDISRSPFNKVQTSGYFLSVRPILGKSEYKVREPDGREQTIPYTEVHSRVFSFGLAGIIIGKPYFGDGDYYAYDLGCPSCDLPSTRLTVSMEGTATCAKCGTSYDLNNSGVATTGTSRPLYRYHASLGGNTLMVHN